MITRRSALFLIPSTLLSARNLRLDVAIVGGGLGGCAAALAALRNGLRVALSEETSWIGGQATSQLVSAFDEHRWIETHGCTRSYREFRNAIRDFYRRHYPLTEPVRGQPNFNPGGGAVSGFQVEPRVALAVLEASLAPYLSSGKLTLLLRHRIAGADVQADRVRSVTLRDVEGLSRVVEASYFLDATELGDLLPLTKTEFVTGFESRKETGEPSAPEVAEPANEQSFTMCLAMDYRAGEDHTIDKPAEYAFWRDYFPKLKPAWPAKLLSWKMSDPRTLASRDLFFDPEDPRRTPAGLLNLWLYRRIAAKDNFAPGAFDSDISVVNWPQNDYWLGRLTTGDVAEQKRQIARAKQLSLSLFYWMQTEQGWKGLRLRPDVAGTVDGVAMYPYVRESRRIRAEFTVLEQHVGADARGKTTAEHFPDSVGTGYYRIDLHPSTGGNNYLDIASLQFQIPLGALIPRRMTNLIAAAKNIGVTHITNGCYRLHPVEWNIGESAGMLAVESIRSRKLPKQIRGDSKLLAEFQGILRKQGIDTEWPKS